jgi:hypothetical protein
MKDKLKGVLIAMTALGALAIGGVAIAGATGGGDDDGSDRAITGLALDTASRVALQHTGGGRVTGTEAGDEEGAYEVEVKKPDGSTVDVHLDSSFKVLDEQADHEGSGEDGPNDR